MKHAVFVKKLDIHVYLFKMKTMMLPTFFDWHHLRLNQLWLCVLGTGTNLCYMEELKNIEKIEQGGVPTKRDEKTHEADEEKVTKFRGAVSKCDELKYELKLFSLSAESWGRHKEKSKF